MRGQCFAQSAMRNTGRSQMPYVIHTSHFCTTHRASRNKDLTLSSSSDQTTESLHTAVFSFPGNYRHRDHRRPSLLPGRSSLSQPGADVEFLSSLEAPADACGFWPLQASMIFFGRQTIGEGQSQKTIRISAAPSTNTVSGSCRLARQ